MTTPIAWPIPTGKCAMGMYSSIAYGSPAPNNLGRASNFLAREKLVRPGYGPAPGSGPSPDRVDIAHVGFYGWTDNPTYNDGSMATDLVTWASDSGKRIPMITWMPGTATNGISGIKDGLNDATIDLMANRLKALPFKVILRFAHEMNGNWYPWNPANAASGYTSAQVFRFREAWRRVYNRFQTAGATNVLFFWCPGTVSAPNDAWNDKWEYYPGDAYVHIVGADGYVNVGETWASNWAAFLADSQVPKPTRPYAATKPVIIGETSQRDSNAPDSRVQFWQDMVTDLTARPYVKGLVFFDQDKRVNEGPEADYRFDAEPYDWGNGQIELQRAYNLPQFNPRYVAAGTFTHGDQVTETNVGLAPTGQPLSTVLGSTVYSTDNALITNTDFTGDVYVQANNVTFQYCRFQGKITNQEQPNRLFHVVDSDIGALSGTYDSGGNGIVGARDFVVKRCVIRNMDEGIRAQMSCSIRDSWIGKITGLGVGPHTDAIQTYGANGGVSGGGGISIIRCNLHGNWVSGNYGNSCIQIGDFPKNMAVTIQDCLFDGGSYSLRIYDAIVGNGLTYTVTGNKWVRGSYQYGPVDASNSDPSNITWSNNTYSDTGEVITL